MEELLKKHFIDGVRFQIFQRKYLTISTCVYLQAESHINI